MDQENLLAYLKRFTADPMVVNVHDMSKSEFESLPQSWRNILTEKGPERCSAVLKYWEPFEAEFEQVIEYLRTHILGVELVHHRIGYCLVYGIQSAKSGKTLYYEGRNPHTKTVSESVKAVWQRLPEKLTEFYDTLHNGWYHLSSWAMGPAPVESFEFLNMNDWGILDTLDNCPVTLNKTISVYTNGGGGYLCLDLSKSKENALIWWTDEKPDLQLDFWPLVDSWTAIGFDC